MAADMEQVKKLREQTGISILECKKAVEEAKGDLTLAAEILRKKGFEKAKAKSSRATNQGAVGAYIHMKGKIGVLVEVACETDFVAKNDDFQELVKDIAMHIAAADPRFVRREEVTSDVLERERAIYAEQAAQSGKPANVVAKIVEGKLEKFYAEACLLEQPFVKNPDVSVGRMVTDAVAKIGENIQVRRFVRFKLGEGIERRESDFAAEVAAAVKG